MSSVTLLEGLEEYVKHCRARGLSESSLRIQRTAVRALWAAVGDVRLRSVTSRHIDEMFALNDWEQSTKNLRISNLKAFFEWARYRRYLPHDVDPMFGYRTRAVPEKPRTRIPLQEWPRLFDACETTFEEAVFATGLYLFLRASEQQGIQFQHVHLEDAEIEVYRVKTRTWDTMPISYELAGYLRQHMAWLSEYAPTNPETYLFPIRTKQLLRDQQGRLIPGTGRLDFTRPFNSPHRTVQRVLERAGYPTKWEGEHTLRRSGARAYFDELSNDGYDRALRRVQSMLGHRNSIMTEVYLGLDVDRRERNTALRGKPMFKSTGANVVSIGKVRRGTV